MTDYRKELNEYREQVLKRKEELRAQLSNVDMKQEDILHFLENEKCDAVTLVKIAKKLKTIRHERRVIKNELYYLIPVCQRLEKPIKVKELCTFYNYRTNIITECTGIAVQDLNKGAITNETHDTE